MITDNEHPADVVEALFDALDQVPGVRLAQGDGPRFALKLLRECYDHYRSQVPQAGDTVAIAPHYDRSAHGTYASHPCLVPGAKAEVMGSYFSREDWAILIRPHEQWHNHFSTGERVDHEPTASFFFSADDVIRDNL